MMKKILAILLVVAMLCSFAACGNNNNTTTTKNEGTTAGTTGNTDTTDTTGTTAGTVEPEPEPEQFPKADTAYYYGMVQENKDNTAYYLAGGMNGYYMETTTEASASMKVYLEETDGGYYLYCYSGETKNYINMTVNGTHVNASFQDAAATVYVYDEVNNTLVATVDGVEYTHGTRNDATYTTAGPVAVSLNGFWCKLYTDETLPDGPVREELPEFDTELTVEQLTKLPVAEEETTTGRYYVSATIKSVTNATYGALIITDSTGATISVYGSYSADGVKRYSELEDQPVKGDTVRLYVNVKNFGGTLEINSAWIQSFEHVEQDYSKYAEMTIAEARQQEKGKLIKVSGVVAAITYASGQIPDGVILVDNTGSILVYDRDLAGRVSVGNKITVAGNKAMWINDSETSNAAKYNYAGSNQLDDAWLIENDNGTNACDYTWVKETTIKEIVDTPITTDISTVIFKVNAYITEKAGTGFTNFYLYDLDGTTGSYVYTKCNGGDFAWLRAYEGKVCTVYMMAINAKSEPSGCFWRFMPIEVVASDVDTSYVNVPEFVIDYFGVDQFDAKYTANPNKELLTTASSALLNIEGAKLSYTSSDETIISVKDGKLVCLADGKVTITITCEYNGKTASKTVEVEYAEKKEGDSISVKEAIDAEVGSEVVVKGIVGPSLVNRKGFYLMSDEGMIAIITDDDTIAGLKIGNTVIIRGTRSVMNKYLTEGNDPSASNHFGQSYIADAVVEWNGYGEATWDTSWYIEGKTAGDLNDMDPMVDYTTNVYKITGTLKLAGYTMTITDANGKTLSLYASGANQYAWLSSYSGQEITISVAVCNWNDKKFWKGRILSLYTENGEIYNELNFSN